MIAEVTASRSCGELVAKLKSAGFAHGLRNDLPDVINHPAIRRLPVELPNKKTAEVPAPPAETPWSPLDFGALPALGQHNEALRAEFS